MKKSTLDDRLDNLVGYGGGRTAAPAKRSRNAARKSTAKKTRRAPAKKTARKAARKR